ncbi:MAG: BREX system ATP-binding domain-containing protein [Acetobacteraceae bacterium]
MNLDARIAIEALRAGVPNRTAVRLMGNEHSLIEHEFDRALLRAWVDRPHGGGRAGTGGAGGGGLGIAGGFGAGKSHLLGYLDEVARGQRFVVSRVTISKETPLAHPAAVFAAAARTAVLPDSTDDAIAGCLATLAERPAALEALEEDLTNGEEGGFAPLFAAIAFLLRRPALPPELSRAIERFLAGGRQPTPLLRQALREAGARTRFALGPVDLHTLAFQRIAFAARLFRAAGYAGWCLLLDEVELIGRYTPLQRAESYAWLATWLGLDAARRFPGIVVAYAITDDFTTAVITAREDRERLPERLRLKGRDAAADLALAAMEHIERTVRDHRLPPPTEGELDACHARLRRLYAEAYDWPAPALAPGERTSSRTMRQYIKSWITEWDMDRLLHQTSTIVTERLASNYDEDATLAEPAPDAGGDDAE